MRKDLSHPKLIVLKGLLFLITAALAATLLLMKSPTLQTAVLLGLCVWAGCRFYFFVFYVLQHYVDPQFRCAGLLDLARHLIRHPPPDPR